MKIYNEQGKKKKKEVINKRKGCIQVVNMYSYSRSLKVYKWELRMVRICPCKGSIRANVLHLREATGLNLKA